MEFWLSHNSEQETLRLPINPASYEISRPSANATINLNGIGEVNVLGPKTLATTSITSFFPKYYAPYCQYSDFPSPEDCVEMLRRWQHSGNPIRYEIRGAGISMPVSIENFAYGQSDAFGNIHYTLDLKEYRFLTATSQTVKVARASKTPPATYKVKSGDTLHGIAKKTTGKSSNKDIIAKINNLGKQALKVGKILIIALEKYGTPTEKRVASYGGGNSNVYTKS